MKKFLLPIIAVLFLGWFNGAKGQYVTIPDTTFVNWLNSNGFAGCLNGNQLDATCSAVTSATSMSCNAVAIRDLTGIQYFTNLTYLDCSNDSLYLIPELPPLLYSFNCEWNNLTSLPVLPAGLEVLGCNDNQLTSLPALPTSLTFLQCDGNQLSALPALPASLGSLSCDYNQFTSLPALPVALSYLSCDDNQLSALPALPTGLNYLFCDDNQLTFLPALPTSLYGLECNDNQLTALPALPVSLNTLQCHNNQLTSLPALSDSLAYLSCQFNLLDFLPTLDTSLAELDCNNNELNVLPALPSSLISLNCSSNQITAIPLLPPGLLQLDCSANPIAILPALPSGLTQLTCGSQDSLTTVPALPDSLYIFNCAQAPNLTCLPELKRIVNFTWYGTALTCLPDYGNITYSNPAVSTMPLCGAINTHGCTVYWSISGQSYYDANNNCVFDSTDVGNQYVKLQLYNAGNLIQQVYSDTGGVYSFGWVPQGGYTVQVDTTNLPFTLECPASGEDSVNLSATDSLSYNNNFAFKCRTVGFDIGVNSTINGYNTPRPNTTFTLSTVAGDMSELYGAHCAAGISGQVQLSFSGPITYAGPAAGALTPTTVSGGTITWNIADYGTVNDFTAFNLLFKIDSLAVPGTSVCFTVTVTPTAGDYNPSNNTLTYCFPVVASLDPNEKEVYPAQVDTGGWLTYTIRFQNTGTAAAVNIRVVDTLSANLDPSTFQLLSYSAKNLTQIFGNVAVFNFPNINLPDSATSDSASRGFVQYKIKVKSNVAPGAAISNRASIYFDSNPPVVTNTVTDSVLTPCSVTYASLGDTVCSGDTVYVGTHAHFVAGTYVDTLINGGGCDSIVTLVLNTIVMPVANFTTAPQVCPGENDTIVFTGVYGPETYISWGFDSANIASPITSLGPNVVNWSSGGTYTISLTLVNTCGYSRDTALVTVLPAPVVSFSWDSMSWDGEFYSPGWPAPGDTGTCGGMYLRFPLHGGHPYGGHYSGRGVINDTLVFDAAFAGYAEPLDTVTYTYTDSSGCSNSASRICTVLLCEGINPLDFNYNITLYPNPATDLIYIQTQGIQAQTTNIYDVNGQLVSTMRFAPQVDVSNLAAGVYLVEVTAPEGTARRRFVKM